MTWMSRSFHEPGGLGYLMQSAKVRAKLADMRLFQPELVQLAQQCIADGVPMLVMRFARAAREEVAT